MEAQSVGQICSKLTFIGASELTYEGGNSESPLTTLGMPLQLRPFPLSYPRPTLALLYRTDTWRFNWQVNYVTRIAMMFNLVG